MTMAEQILDQSSGRAAAWYAIGAVARKTGLTVHTLRAWERRYGVVEPQRSGGGSRLYSTSDIVRLRLLRRATDAGHSIGQIAGMDVEQLRDLLRDEPTASPPAVADEGGETEVRWVVAEILKAVELMDGSRIHSLLMRAVVNFPAREVIEKIVIPVLQRVGDLWAEGTLCPANEHLLTISVRRVISWLTESLPVEANAPTILVTTPKGQWHDLPAQIGGSVAAMAGWRVVFLGPNLEAEDIESAVAITDARAVLLGVTIAESESLVEQLELLSTGLQREVKVLVGGKGMEMWRERLAEIGMEWLPDYGALETSLRSITQKLNHAA